MRKSSEFEAVQAQVCLTGEYSEKKLICLNFKIKLLLYSQHLNKSLHLLCEPQVQTAQRLSILLPYLVLA